MFESCISAGHHLKHNSCLNTKAANPILFSEWLLVKIMALLWFHRKVWWNCVALFRWAMCMTFPSDALRVRIKEWCPYVLSRSGTALCFTRFARWRGHFKKKQALSGLSFSHAHTICCSTLSSVWQCHSYCSSWIKLHASKTFSGEIFYLLTDNYLYFLCYVF